MRNSTEDIYQQKANRVIDFIGANLHKPLSLDEMADRINVSQRQLLRIMRLSLNEPLAAYIARQRVERAVMYLQTEDMPNASLRIQSFGEKTERPGGQSPIRGNGHERRM
jgi:transcriptional regulator GlxA family with amidase domain